MKITKKENQKKVVYNFAIISYQKEDEKRVILKRLTIPLACTPIESYEEFCAVVESIEKQYNQKYGDATVLIALPMDFSALFRDVIGLNRQLKMRSVTL